MSHSHPSPGWFRKHFNEDYRTIYPGRGQAEAEAEVALIVKKLKIRPGEAVLDLCCGFGRHLTVFEQRGIHAIGVDLSLLLLLQVACPGGRRNVVCADMRALPFAGGGRGFPVLVNLFTSFGYFDSDDENQQAAHEMARVLKPGGRFAMDLMNAGPAVRSLEQRTERDAGPFHVIEERSYDPRRRRIEKHILLLREGAKEPRAYFESVRVFAPDEISALLTRAGLKVKEMLGDFTGSSYDEESPRMIVLGRKS